jgi:hypothetical protein
MYTMYIGDGRAEKGKEKRDGGRERKKTEWIRKMTCHAKMTIRVYRSHPPLAIRQTGL